MDEQAIRVWAWEQCRLYGRKIPQEDGTEKHVVCGLPELLELSDQLAAWVMSGKLPELSVQSEDTDA